MNQKIFSIKEIGLNPAMLNTKKPFWWGRVLNSKSTRP
jgi:hypothetical protein